MTWWFSACTGGRPGKRLSYDRKTCPFLVPALLREGRHRAFHSAMEAPLTVIPAEAGIQGWCGAAGVTYTEWLRRQYGVGGAL